METRIFFLEKLTSMITGRRIDLNKSAVGTVSPSSGTLNVKLWSSHLRILCYKRQDTNNIGYYLNVPIMGNFVYNLAKTGKAIISKISCFTLIVSSVTVISCFFVLNCGVHCGRVLAWLALHQLHSAFINCTEMFTKNFEGF